LKALLKRGVKMHYDGILLLVNELVMHKATMSERACLQSKESTSWMVLSFFYYRT